LLNIQKELQSISSRLVPLRGGIWDSSLKMSENKSWIWIQCKLDSSRKSFCESIIYIQWVLTRKPIRECLNLVWHCKQALILSTEGIFTAVVHIWICIIRSCQKSIRKQILGLMLSSEIQDGFRMVLDISSKVLDLWISGFQEFLDLESNRNLYMVLGLDLKRPLETSAFLY